jgi:hypothetical protein
MQQTTAVTAEKMRQHRQIILQELLLKHASTKRNMPVA